jgi:tetratricopeptide (TPR) repeat protein
MNNKERAREMFEKGVYAFTQGKYDMSISNFSSALYFDSEFALAYLSRGVAYGKREKISQALADFDRAIALNPRYARAYHLRGLAYLKLGEREEAVHDFNKAIELNPQYGAAYYSRGTAHSELGNVEQAGKDMVMAARLGEANLQGFADEHNIWRTKYHKLEAEILGDRERDWGVTPELKSWFEAETEKESVQ